MFFFAILLCWASAVELNDRDRNGYSAKPYGSVCVTDLKRVQRLVNTVKECQLATMEVQKSCAGRYTPTCQSEWDGGVNEINSDNYPMGCFAKGDKRFFNVNQANKGNSKARAICTISDAVTYTSSRAGPGSSPWGAQSKWPLMITSHFGTDSSLVECGERCIGECYPVDCHPTSASYKMDFSGVLSRNVEAASYEAGNRFVKKAAVGVSIVGLVSLVVCVYVKTAKTDDSHNELV